MPVDRASSILVHFAKIRENTESQATVPQSFWWQVGGSQIRYALERRGGRTRQRLWARKGLVLGREDLYLYEWLACSDHWARRVVA